MTTTTTKSAEAPEMPIADRLEHCAKFTGLDAVRELLLEAAAAVRKRDAVVKLLEGELQAIAQATQAEVTGEREAFESCALMEGSLFKRRADDPDKYWDGNVQDDWELWQARAILALRPERVPITAEQIRSMCKQGWVFETAKQWVRIIEAHHGITAQAKKETP